MPYHADSQNVGMGHGKMLVLDAAVDAHGLMCGERDGFTAIAAGFGSQLGFGEFAALTGDTRGC